jgi:DNA invertase Pin-like site-specific DNA recombinase
MNALVYVRFSTEQQSQGDSSRRQRELAEAVAHQRGLKIIEWVEDLGVSAYRGSHIETGNLGKLLDRIKAGKIERGTYLLFENFDRLSRLHVFDSTRVILDLYDAGLILITTADNTIHGRDQGLLGLLRPMIEGERAHSESATKASRGRQIWENKRAKALNGEKMTSVIPAWLMAIKDAKGRVIDFKPIPERATLIVQMFTDTAHGMGKVAIAKRLNAARVAHWNASKGWYPSYIERILGSRAVIGEYQPHRRVAREFNAELRKRIGGKRIAEGQPIEGYYPAVVSLSLWERAKAARAGRRGKGGRKGTTLSNLFSGLCKCWICFGTMTFRHPGSGSKAGRSYLICDGALRKAGCGEDTKYYYQQVEDIILSNLSDLLFDPADLAAHTEAISRAETAVVAIVNQRMAKQAEIGRLIDAIASGTNQYIADAINARGIEVEALKERESAARAALEELRGKTTATERQAAVDALAGDLASSDEAIRYAARSRLAQEVKSVVTKIIFEPGAIVIEVANGLRLYDIDSQGRLRALELNNFGKPLSDQQQRIAERIARIRRINPKHAHLDTL